MKNGENKENNNHRLRLVEGGRDCAILVAAYLGKQSEDPSGLVFVRLVPRWLC